MKQETKVVSVRCPTCPYFVKQLTYGTEAYIRNFQIKYIPNCSHWVQQEQPTLVNHYMREFLGV